MKHIDFRELWEDHAENVLTLILGITVSVVCTFAFITREVVSKSKGLAVVIGEADPYTDAKILKNILTSERYQISIDKSVVGDTVEVFESTITLLSEFSVTSKQAYLKGTPDENK